jgi:endothelin-converting enzyme/putative endopeptidase
MRRSLALVLLAAACHAQAPAAPHGAPAARAGVQPGDIDRSVDPCVDFFAYANGAWRAQNPIPPSMDRWSRRWQAGEANKERLSEILEGLAQRRDARPGSLEQQLGDFYASCMDEAAADRAGAQPLAPLLGQIDAIANSKDVQRVVRRLHDQGVLVPFSLRSQPDAHDPRRTLANLAAGGLGLPDRDYYFKPEPRFVEARARYLTHVAKMFTLLGRSPGEAEAAAAAVMALETRLAEATLDNVARRDPKAVDHPTSFAALAKLAPHIEWAELFDEARLARADLNVDEPAFVAAVDRELAATPPAAWRAYLTWQLVNTAAPWLSKGFVDERFGFRQKFLSGVTEMKPRGTRCAELIDGELGEALGQKYVERYFPPAAKARARALVENELAAMREILETRSWMGAATKKKALEKLAAIDLKIGYPDKWQDYSSVVIRRDALWENLLAAQRFDMAVDRARVGKPTDRGLWTMTASTSNAYYNALLNEIVFPAGILQAPAFDVGASDAANYGAIGLVIGHEISHGFDDEGAQFDADGRLANWWTPDDLKNFQARGECVAQQFESYFIEPGIHHNGHLVLGESIGDLGGARIAFRAFEQARAAHPEAPAPGMSAEQEFFVAWGQFRGDEIRPARQRVMVQGDPHPVSKFRVIGPLANLPGFAQAFSCKPDAPMVRPPEQRCEVW